MHHDLSSTDPGGSSKGRTSGFGPENRGSNPCPPARRNSIVRMSAPIVVILAAGRGTRMRSRLPKVLHELCGRPMVLWPVTAALAAGAGRIVVVDTPQRELEPVLPEGVELAVQERPDGTGGALAAAMGAGLDPDAPVVVLSGDVPLIDGQAIRDLVDAHRSS